MYSKKRKSYFTTGYFLFKHSIVTALCVILTAKTKTNVHYLEIVQSSTAAIIKPAWNPSHEYTLAELKCRQSHYNGLVYH